jgi:hypothetical protein
VVRGRRRQHLLLADENLISFVGQGDADAFTTLYDRHSHAAFFPRFLLLHLNLGSHLATAATPKEVQGASLRAIPAAKSSMFVAVSWRPTIERGGNPSS